MTIASISSGSRRAPPADALHACGARGEIVTRGMTGPMSHALLPRPFLAPQRAPAPQPSSNRRLRQHRGKYNRHKRGSKPVIIPGLVQPASRFALRRIRTLRDRHFSSLKDLRRKACERKLHLLWVRPSLPELPNSPQCVTNIPDPIRQPFFQRSFLPEASPHEHNCRGNDKSEADDDHQYDIERFGFHLPPIVPDQTRARERSLSGAGWLASFFT